MCAKFRENQSKTVGRVAILKKYDDIQSDSSQRYYKVRLLQASSGAKNLI